MAQLDFSSQAVSPGSGKALDFSAQAVGAKPATFVDEMSQNFGQGTKALGDLVSGNFEDFDRPMPSPKTDKLSSELISPGFQGNSTSEIIQEIGKNIGKTKPSDYSAALLEKIGNTPEGKILTALVGIHPLYNVISTAVNRYANPAIENFTGVAPENLEVMEMAAPALGIKKAGEIKDPVATGASMATKGAVDAAGNAFSKKINPAVELLRKEGIELTPGMLAKDSIEPIKTAEGAMKSLPFAGDIVKNAAKNSQLSFNQAVLNRALGNVGVKMPKDLQAGRKAIDYAEKQIGAKYDTLLPNLKFQLDNQFIDDLNAFEKSTKARLSPERQKQFEDIIESISEHRLDQNLSMTGQQFKDAESELSAEARAYRRASDPDQTKLANALDEFHGIMKDNLARMNPTYAEELQKINTAWAMFKRAQEASIRRAGSRGVFTPSDFLQAVKSGSSKGSFARGDAMLQDLADAAGEVIPDTVPDSGTATRLGWSHLLMGLPSLAATAPVLPLYTRGGMRALGDWAAPRPAKGKTP